MKPLKPIKTWIITFLICFLLGIIAIPVALHSERRIYQDLSDFEFILLAICIAAGYSLLLSSISVFGTYYYIKRKTNKISSTDG